MLQVHICNKDEAIKTPPRPKETEQLRSIFGLVNYYGKFVENLHTDCMISCDMYNVRWNWNDCEAAFHKLKKHFKLACDASSYGVGMVIANVMKGWLLSWILHEGKKLDL